MNTDTLRGKHQEYEKFWTDTDTKKERYEQNAIVGFCYNGVQCFFILTELACVCEILCMYFFNNIYCHAALHF